MSEPIKPLPDTASPQAAAEQVFVHKHLAQGLELVGGSFRFSQAIGDDEPLLAGRLYDMRALQPGLILHRAQGRDLQSLHSQVLQQPGIKLSLLAAGSTEVAYGRRRYHLGPQANDTRRNQAALVALAEPDTFSRHWRRGREECKISITLKPQWLEQAGFGMLNEHTRLATFANEHMSERAWLPSPQAMLAVQQVLQPPPLLPALQEIFIQSRCLDIIVEALSLIAHADAAAAEPRGLNPRAQRQLRQLQELLDSGAADEWSLPAIASHVGSNPTSLQQLFRREKGFTIFEYQRQRRLQRARIALSQQGISVEEAAAIAGYSSAANFATAFKRLFGITPRAARG